jgi:hypothetical protein
MTEAPRRTDAPRYRAIRPATILDRLDTPDGTVVLVDTGYGHRVIRLSVLGSAVLDTLDGAGGSSDLATLTSALVSQLGAPNGIDPEVAVRDVVDALAAERIVVAEL